MATATSRGIVQRPVVISRERRFFIAFSVTLIAATLLGFARSFFLKFFYSEWAAANTAQEPFFFLHGVIFTAWLVMFAAQTSLVSVRRVDLHRKLGWIGAALALLMIVVGFAASMIAAKRPTGFFNVPIPPDQFLIIPLSDVFLFAIFVALAIMHRKNPQSHKRLMLLGSIVILDAAVGRWPFAILTAPSPIAAFTMSDLILDLFLLPMFAWDLISLRRIHNATIFGALALIGIQVIRNFGMDSPAWIAISQWLLH